MMKKGIMRKGIAIVLFSVLIGTIGIPLSCFVDNHGVLADNQDDIIESIWFSVSFSAPTISTQQIADTTFYDIHMNGCIGKATHPGDPIIPVKYITLLLPPCRSVETVTVTGTPIELSITGKNVTHYQVLPSQNQRPTGETVLTDFIRNEEIYSSHNPYPRGTYSEYHSGYSHGYTLLGITLQPVSIIPAEGRCFYYPEMSLNITLTKSIQSQVLFRDTAEDKAWVRSLVSNPEVLARYTHLPVLEYPGGLCDPTDQYDYVIITTTENSLDHWETNQYTPYNWDSLMDQHAGDGLTCTLVTTQDILACQDYYNATPLFNDSQARIREFCRDAYQDWETQYVLIGADAEFIPARQLFYGYEGNVDSDLYWSNLDNTFNADYDTYWGEEGDNGFDPYSEIFIGRIPCDIPKDVSNWLSKSFFYSTATDAEYLENGGFFATNGSSWPGTTESDDIIDFAAIKGTSDWLGPDPGQGGPWPTWLGFLYGFETWNELHPDDAFNISVRWTYCDPNPGWHQGDAVEELRNAINNDTVTLITGIGHGGPERVLDVYTSDWDSAYHNTMPFFLCDLGCHSGDIDGSDDGVLGAMLFHSNTSLAFGCLFNSGFTWVNAYNTNSSVALQTKLFWDYFFDLMNNSGSDQNWQFGKALAWSKDTLAPTLSWDSTWRGILECRLLFADPAQQLRRPHSNAPPETPIISWSQETGLSLYTIDPDGDDVYYMVDWGDGTDLQWVGPYPSGVYVSILHTYAYPGMYEVKARAKDIHNAMSEWSGLLLISIQGPEIMIDALHGGLNLTVTLQNTGVIDASNVEWMITLSGGLIFYGKEKSGTLDCLQAGETQSVHSFVIGFGKTRITVHASCEEGGFVEKTASAVIILFLVVGVQ